ncbi:MAG: hypothetical protein VKJ64_03550 [Leptolyngbyaceae bacterium]|nr:hypothetical protein [Leptolyngbyaceae bacterium]
MKHLLLWTATLTTITSASFWLIGHATSAAPAAKIQVGLTQHPATQSATKQNTDEPADSIAGDWIPDGRIDPNRPASIILINNTAVSLQYAFSTTGMDPQPLAPGDTVTLSNVPVPSTLLINALDPRAVLDYAVGPIDEPSEAGEGEPEAVDDQPVDDNAVTVTIRLVDQQYNAAGFSAIDIHETGALYRY